MSGQLVTSVGQIEERILMIRGQRVILASDLAKMYGVPVKRLNEQVQRNADRFLKDFVFRLTKAEAASLRSQIATLNVSDLKPQDATSRRGRHAKFLPYAFTEHGVVMAANVLRSPKAVKVSVFVVRAFVKLREMLSAHKELGHKLDQLEHKLQDHDKQILSLVQAMRQLMRQPDDPPRPRIGYETESDRRK